MSRPTRGFRQTAITIFASTLVLPLAAEALQVCPVQPCRVLDTRSATDVNVDHPLAPGETATIYVANSGPATLAGQGGEDHCDVPFPQAKGVFVNVVAVDPDPVGSGVNFMTLYPAETERPLAASINYEPDTFALANGIFVKVCDEATAPSSCNPGDLSIYNGLGSSVDVVIDVTGYVAASCP